MSRSLLELVPLAISEGPLVFGTNLPYSQQLAQNTQPETFNFLLSLPHEDIGNRPGLFRFLLKFASPAVVHMLMDLPLEENPD